VSFEKNTHATLQFSGYAMGSFIMTENHEPPEIKSLICGITNPVTKKYIYWFHCSTQFYLLYLLITYGRDHAVFKDKNKVQIMDY